MLCFLMLFLLFPMVFSSLRHCGHCTIVTFGKCLVLDEDTLKTKLNTWHFQVICTCMKITRSVRHHHIQVNTVLNLRVPSVWPRFWILEFSKRQTYPRLVNCFSNYLFTYLFIYSSENFKIWILMNRTRIKYVLWLLLCSSKLGSSYHQ